MNIDAIKSIVNSELTEDEQRYWIIRLISTDKQAIPDILAILQEERETNRALISDMNLELSRAHIYIEMRPEGKREAKQSFNKEFVLEKIANFYEIYRGVVSHCFNRFQGQ